MRGKWVLYAVVAVLVGAGGAALSTHWRGRAKAPARKNDAALIQNGSEVTISGKLRPQHITVVKADMDGDIDSFEVDVGAEVYEGQVLAHIGSSGLESQHDAIQATVTYAEGQVTKAESNVASARMESSRADADQQRSRSALDKAKSEYEHYQNLWSHGATPKQRWEKAQSDYQAAQKDFDIMNSAARLSAEQVQTMLNALTAAQTDLTARNQELQQAQEHMQSAEVRSPVDGIVVARNGEPGKPAGADIFDIATDMFALEVPLEPKPEVLRRLHPGQQAMVLILDLQSAGIPGQIREIKDNQAIVEFNCALPAVKPGMSVGVRLKLD